MFSYFCTKIWLVHSDITTEFLRAIEMPFYLHDINNHIWFEIKLNWNCDCIACFHKCGHANLFCLWTVIHECFLCAPLRISKRTFRNPSRFGQNVHVIFDDSLLHCFRYILIFFQGTIANTECVAIRFLSKFAAF